MELPLLGIRFLLALVFLTASLPKLAAPNDFRRALRNYQLVPLRLVRPVATWLPRFELALAVALLVGVAAPITASLTATALLVFSAAVAFNLARGRKIECGCFSGSSPREITWRLVLQDVVLAASAIGVATEAPPMWAGNESFAVFFAAAFALVVVQLATEWMRLRRAVSASLCGPRARMTVPWIVVLCLLSVCVLLTALVVLGALRRISSVLEQAEARLRDLPAEASSGPGGLELGATLPAFEADRLGGGDPLTDVELRGSPATILFLSASCPPCATLARDLRRQDRDESVYVVVSEPNDAEKLRLTEAQPVLIQRNGQLSEAFKTSATPHAFVFNSTGILVAAGTPNSGAALRRLAVTVLEEGGDAVGHEAMETISI